MSEDISLVVASKGSKYKLSPKEIIFKYIIYLPLFILTLGISITVAYIYLRYQIPYYSSSISLIIKDDKGWYPQIQLHYYLTIGNKHLSQRDNAKLDSLAPDSQPFKPDGNRSCLSAKVKALQALRIEQFFGEDLIFTDDSLRQWHNQLLSCRLHVKELLGITISPTSHPVRAAQQLLIVDRSGVRGISPRTP